MLDIELIRNNPQKVQEALSKKLWDVNFDELLKWDEERKTKLKILEDKRAEKNKLSASVPLAKKNGEDVSLIFKKVKEIDLNNKVLEGEVKEIEKNIFDFLDELPNLPDDDIPAGGKENNVVLEVHGEKPVFDFALKDHVELEKSLGLVDYDRGAKIAGSGSWVYTNLGAQLEWALVNFFISKHLKNGFTFILPPHLLNEESGHVAGQFPKFKEDVFWLTGVEPKRFLLPTAETALVNFHRNEILSENELPKKYFAYTPCYRSEAGSYRSEERGTIRGYQFNKVEMVQYTKQEDSDKAFDELVSVACSIMNDLGLHYRVSKLAAADISHSMCRTFDIEVYLPSLGIYKEVSSASNARDYQARRGMIRYRDSETGKTKFVHTLNASGLATSRVFPAILEQFQQADGSVNIPEVLQPFMGGLKEIKPIK